MTQDAPHPLAGVEDIAYGLTHSLVHQAAELVAPRPDDRADDPVEATRIALAFVRNHHAHELWPTVAHLAVAAVRSGAADVTQEVVRRVLMETASRDVRRQILGIIPLVWPAD